MRSHLLRFLAGLFVLACALNTARAQSFGDIGTIPWSVPRCYSDHGWQAGSHEHWKPACASAPENSGASR